MIILTYMREKRVVGKGGREGVIVASFSRPASTSAAM